MQTSLELVIRRVAVASFCLLLLLVIPAFWPRYFSNPGQQTWTIVHAHALGMTAWCAFLVVQALLIRFNLRTIHRLLGWASLALFAANLLLLVMVLRRRASQIELLWESGILSDAGLVFLSQAVIGTGLFAAFYLAAIVFRKCRAVHGSLMICTVFPILSPVVDRIVNFYVPALGARLPEVAGVAHVPLIGWLLTDICLIVFVVLERRYSDKPRVFPMVLGIMVTYQLFTVKAHEFLFWQMFGDWFLSA